MTGNGETITQKHRDMAAAALKGDDPKTVQVRASILAGTSDEHPAVQAAAFFGDKGFPKTARELLAMTPEERVAHLPDTIPEAWALVQSMTWDVEDIASAQPVVEMAKAFPADFPGRVDMLRMLHATIVRKLINKGVDPEKIADLLPLRHIFA